MTDRVACKAGRSQNRLVGVTPWTVHRGDRGPCANSADESVMTLRLLNPDASVTAIQISLFWAYLVL